MNRSLRPLLLAISALLLLALTVQATAAADRPIRLSPQQETVKVTGTNARGTFSYFVDGSDLCYTLEVRDLTAAPFAAHIHEGARKVAGGIVVGLTTPPGATSTISGCITAVADDVGATSLSTAELAAIIANPRSFYVNVHTTLWPAGEIRGQLR